MMGSGAMVGSYFGAKLTGKVNLNTLIGAMGLVLLGVGTLLVFQPYRLSVNLGFSCHQSSRKKHLNAASGNVAPEAAKNLSGRKV